MIPRRTKPVLLPFLLQLAAIVTLFLFPSVIDAQTITPSAGPSMSPTESTTSASSPTRLPTNSPTEGTIFTAIIPIKCLRNEDCSMAHVCIQQTCIALPSNSQLKSIHSGNDTQGENDIGYAFSFSALVLLASALLAHTKIKEKAFRKAIAGETRVVPNTNTGNNNEGGGAQGRGSLTKALSSIVNGSSRANITSEGTEGVAFGSQNPLFYDELGEVYTARDRMTRTGSVMSDVSMYDYPRGVSRASFESEFDRNSMALAKDNDEGHGAFPHEIIRVNNNENIQQRPAIGRKSQQDSGSLDIFDVGNLRNDNSSNSNSNNGRGELAQVWSDALSESGGNHEQHISDDEELITTRKMNGQIGSVTEATARRTSGTGDIQTTAKPKHSRSSSHRSQVTNKPVGNVSTTTDRGRRLSPPSTTNPNIPTPRKPDAQPLHRYRGAGYGVSKWGSSMTIVVEQDGNNSDTSEEEEDTEPVHHQEDSSASPELSRDKDSFAELEHRRSRISFGSFISANSLASGARRVRNSLGSFSSSISDAVRKRTISRASFGSFSSAPGMSGLAGRQRVGTNTTSFDSLSSFAEMSDHRRSTSVGVDHRRSASGGMMDMSMGHHRATSVGLADDGWGSMSTMHNLSLVEEEKADDLESSTSSRSLSASSSAGTPAAAADVAK